MKFNIKRTSSYNDNNKPIDDDRLTHEKYDCIEVRSCTEEEFNKKFSSNEGTWRIKGIDHKICNDGKYIQRTFKKQKEGWFIEINTLEELMLLKEKCGCEIVITCCMWNGEIKTIEIYDDWRE